MKHAWIIKAREVQVGDMVRIISQGYGFDTKVLLIEEHSSSPRCRSFHMDKVGDVPLDNEDDVLLIGRPLPEGKTSANMMASVSENLRSCVTAEIKNDGPYLVVEARHDDSSPDSSAVLALLRDTIDAYLMSLGAK